jgi:peptidoglycan/LPS O-acetylase OafA/YrhL
MYFYLCFAFMIFLSGSRRLALPFLLLIWTVAVFSLNALFHLLEISNPIASVVAHPLTLEFILGAVAGILVQRKIAIFPASALTAGIIACVIVLSFRDAAMALANGLTWTRAILVGTPCALIVYGAVATEIRGARITPDWLAALGDASYSTYLSHVLVLSALGRLFALAPGHGIALEAAFVVFCVVTANIAGLLSCRVIERRSANAARSRPKKVRQEETESLFGR